MNIAEATIRSSITATVAVVVMIVVGVGAYFSMGRLEDPEFTIKEALVITHYPGASAREVADEVTEEIESAVQRMGQLDRVTSVSEPGRSIVTVVIKDRYDGAALPQIWDELRRRVDDAARLLPPGATTPVVRDDFGDVYGVFYAIYGDGYSYSDLEAHAETIRRELLLIPDVGKVALFGEQPEAVFVEFSTERLAQLGVSQDVLFAVLSGQNLAVPAGEVVAGRQRLRLDPTGQFRSVEEIGNLLIPQASTAGTRLYLRDIAEISRGYIDPPTTLMRFNGRPAVGLAISTVLGGNVVRMGEAVEQRMEELQTQIPIGIETGLIAHQAKTVNAAIQVFVSSLVQAFAIVIGTLMIFMGWRGGLIIGLVLVLTVLGTFVIMKSTGVMLERVSLGALVIALALMVDNAIVIVDGMQANIRKGIDRVESAGRIVKQSMFPLLGATVVAVLAFAAIGLSQNSTGEYTRSLYYVMLYSLLLSWVLAITITPLFGYWLLKPSADTGKKPYDNAIFNAYRGLLDWCLRHRLITLVPLVLLMVYAVIAFGYVERSFFPPSTRPQFMVHVWGPQGQSIEATEAAAADIDEYLRTIEDVTDTATFVGAGSPRFLLTYTPENHNPAYALLLVAVDDHRVIAPMMRTIEERIRQDHPDLFVIARQFALGPGDNQKIQLRVRGPDPDRLHPIRDQVVAALGADPDIIDVQDDWRQRNPIVTPVVNEMQARDAGLTRRDIADSMMYFTRGMRIGVYREGDDVIPIIARPREDERERLADVRDAQIWAPAVQRRLPMRQFVSEFRTDSEFTYLHRRDRLPTITVYADARSGDADGAVHRLIPAIEAIQLPPGYSIEWGGEFESSRDAQAALAGNFPVVGLLMAITVIALFNALRPPLIVLIVVPLAIIGVSLGLLFGRQPFGFMALLGFMSLSGMLIKNAIVLLDEIRLRVRSGTNKPFDAIREAGVSRLSPVVLAAVTTVLGMIPLLPDDFFVAMAVTIMAGLTFATILTMIVVPVLYSLFYRITPATPAPQAAATDA